MNQTQVKLASAAKPRDRIRRLDRIQSVAAAQALFTLETLTASGFVIQRLKAFVQLYSMLRRELATNL